MAHEAGQSINRSGSPIAVADANSEYWPLHYSGLGMVEEIKC
jgi:hypothetical protein